jgi:hypothetical protein
MCDVLVAEVGGRVFIDGTAGGEVSAAPSALASEGPSLAREGQAQGPRWRSSTPARPQPSLARKPTPACPPRPRQRERVKRISSFVLMKLINSVRRSLVGAGRRSRSRVAPVRARCDADASPAVASGRIQAPPRPRAPQSARPTRRRTSHASPRRGGAKGINPLHQSNPGAPLHVRVSFRSVNPTLHRSARQNRTNWHVRTRYTHSPRRVQSDHKQPCTYVHATRVAIHAHPGRHELAPLSTTPFSPTRHTPHPSTHTRGFAFVTLPVFFVSAQGVSKGSFRHRAATTRRPMLTSRTGSRPCA